MTDFVSYCVIPYARGRVRSKPIEQIKSEVSTLADKGFSEIVLVGINLSAYGKVCGRKVLQCSCGGLRER